MVASTVAQHPRKDLVQVTVPASAAGADASVYVQAPRAGTVQAVRYTSVTAITGAATNNRTFNCINKGAAGTGTAVAATLNMANGVNTVALVPKAITVSAVAADVAVSEGDVIQFQSLHIGTGIADPGGVVVFEFGPPAAGN
jgi:hypothetical protein